MPDKVLKGESEVRDFLRKCYENNGIPLVRRKNGKLYIACYSYEVVGARIDGVSSERVREIIYEIIRNKEVSKENR